MIKHAAGWDCPVSLVARLDHMNTHPRTPDNLEVLRRWEDVRNSDFLTDKIRESLKDPEKEHILLLDEDGEFELQVCEQLINAAGGNPEMRAFIFDRAGRTYVAYWHTSGEAAAELPLNPDKVKLHGAIGSLLPVQKNDPGTRIPVWNRLYLEFNLPREEVIAVMEKARMVPAQ